MQAFFGGFSAQFGKQLILGILLPVSLFLGLWIVLMEPLIPESLSLPRRLTLPSEAWQIGSFAFLSVAFTAMLYNLNDALIRLLEGYPWRWSWLGQWRISVNRGRHERLSTQIQALVGLLALPTVVWPHRDVMERRLGELRIQRNSKYPPFPQHVLPTRLGNIIRAFETYPGTAYGLDGVVFWPALVAAVGKEKLEVVGEARTSFDFTVQLTVLTAAFAVFSGGYGLAIGFTKGPQQALPFALATVLAGIGMLVAYRMACASALIWGVHVRRAFDLNRAALWSSYGMKEPPVDAKEERALGTKLSQQLIFGDELYYEMPGDTAMSAEPYFKVPSPLPPMAAVTQLGNSLAVTRSVRPLFPKGLRIHLRVQGFDDAEAGEVTLTDTLPSGWLLRTGSAKVDGQPREPRGSQVLKFALGDIPQNAVIIVEYDAYPLTP